MKKAVILLSGGLDSTTCLAIAKSQGFDCYALSFNYGQRHARELAAAETIAAMFGVVEHRVVNFDLTQLGGSALTDASLSVPDYSDSEAIPLTYVPARNTLFLSIAMGFAEVIGANDIFIGANEVDYSHYPDCRKEFIDAFTVMANLATKRAIEGHLLTIHAPLLSMTKAHIITTGIALGVDYAMTRSCYQLNEQDEACGRCDSCVLRKRGFQAANVADPTRYVVDL